MNTYEKEFWEKMERANVQQLSWLVKRLAYEIKDDKEKIKELEKRIEKLEGKA